MILLKERHNVRIGNSVYNMFNYLCNILLVNKGEKYANRLEMVFNRVGSWFITRLPANNRIPELLYLGTNRGIKMEAVAGISCLVCITVIICVVAVILGR